MKKNRNLKHLFIQSIKVIAICLVLIVLAITISLILLIKSQCNESYLNSVKSPDNRSKAVTYVLDCGMTVDFVTKVKIVNANVDENSGWFFNDVFKVEGWQENIHTVWIDKDHLKINYGMEDDFIFQKESKYRGIEIEYEKMTPAKTI